MEYDFRFGLSTGLKKLKMTKRELADLSGMGYYNLSFLPDKWNPSLLTLFCAIDAMNVTCDSFLRLCCGQTEELVHSDKDHSGYVDIINSILSSRKIKPKSSFLRLLEICEIFDCPIISLFEMIEEKCPAKTGKEHSCNTVQ